MDSTTPRNARRLLIGAIVVVLAAIAALLWPERPKAPEAAGAASVDAVPPNEPPPAAATPSDTPPAVGQSAQARMLALRRDAAAGIPAAMRDLAEVMQRCGFGKLHGPLFEKHVDEMAAQMKADQVHLLRAAAARRQAQCETIPGTFDEQVQQQRQLLQDAAGKGDLLARLRQRTRAFTAQARAELPDDADALIDEALMSSDPRALFELASLHNTSPELLAKAGMRTTSSDGAALVLVACERGLDCSASSEFGDDLCIASAMCTEDLDTVVLNAAGAEGRTEEVQSRLQWMRTMLDEVDRAR